ncbi:MAG: SPFH domain-containing protein [Candidatus Diapherotrites archaeon]
MQARQIKQVFFLLMVALVFFLLFLLLQFQEIIVQNLVLVAIAAAILFLLWRYDYVLQLKEYERAVIFRFDKFHRVVGPGWVVIFQPIDEYVKIDTRIQTVDIPKQDVITADGIELNIDAILYVRVKKDAESVYRAVIEVEDYKRALVLYVLASIRDIVGSMPLNEVISNIETLNTKLKEGLTAISKDWGVECTSVEIKDVQIPKTVMDAMHEEKAAVQRKLGRMEEAKAHQAEIDAVREAAEQLSDKALAYYYIRALEKLGEGKSTKFIFPMEISRLAEAVGGRIGGKQSGELEELFRKYAPALQAIVEKNGKKKK